MQKLSIENEAMMSAYFILSFSVAAQTATTPYHTASSKRGFDLTVSASGSDNHLITPVVQYE
jgi:hypothetical protein